MSKRFIEAEQIIAARANIVCTIAKLTKTLKNKLYLTNLGKSYLNASEGEKFIFLFEAYTRMNLGYFDGMQESALFNAVYLDYLQILRDKETLFRTPNVYSALLLAQQPHIGIEIESHIECNSSYLDKSPYDEFDHMIKVRAFQRFFAQFALIEVRGDSYKEEYEIQKTSLLDLFIEPKNVIQADQLLSKKRFKEFAQRIKDDKLYDINLFEDFCYLYANTAQHPFIRTDVVIEDIIRRKKLLGDQEIRQRSFYSDLYDSVKATMIHFTQYETKGAHSKDIKDAFENFIDGIVILLASIEKPYKLFDAIQSSTAIVFQLLNNTYGLDINKEGFIDRIENRLSKEVAEDISIFIQTLSHFHKRSLKVKRITSEIKAVSRDAIFSYVLVVMSLYSFEKEA